MIKQHIDNDIPQDERKEIVKGQTYFQRAQEDASGLSGRYKHLTKVTVIGAGGPAYPAMPDGNPWKEYPVPSVPDPLGYSVEDDNK